MPTPKPIKPSDLSDLVGKPEPGDRPIGPHLWSTPLPTSGRHRIMESVRK